ncbi:MAG: orotate phosphoribosyltransferase [Candidatus Krumholzibacteriota bacterium]|nr:orotate phosphoribosyltransferase [Candidatus Krumholzibacteriota bacterium]
MNKRDELKQILITRSILKGEFTLASGKKSNYYINGKMTTLYSRGLYLTARLLLDRLDSIEYDAIAGPVIGADPIIGAMLTLSASRKENREGFLIRKESKAHGTKKIIEGRFKEGSKTIIVEDVVTTGGSLLRAAKAISEAGGIIAGIIVLVDREEGAEQNIASEGYDLMSVFKVSELL